MKTSIEIIIENVEIDEHYFNFDYKVYVNGKFKTDGEYQNDHVWGNDKSGFKDILMSGEAVNLVLQEVFV